MRAALVLLALSGPAAHAQISSVKESEFDRGCDTTIDLRTPGEAMEHVGVRDQTSEAHCYAEVAAQMVDAWRFTHGDTHYAHQTSGYALALEASLNLFETGISRPDGTVSGGDVCRAVTSARNTGSCDRRAVLEHLIEGRIDRTVDILRGYYDEYHAWRDSRSATLAGIEAMTRGGASPGQEIACQLYTEILDRRIDSELRPSLDAILQLLDEENPLDYLQGMMTQACQAPHVIRLSRLPSCTNLPTLSASMANGAVARSLQSQRQPVAISYCSSVLSGGRGTETGAYGLLPAIARVPLPSCYPHVSLVIGQRRNPTTRRCQFLVRNSWGDSCLGTGPASGRSSAQYSSDWQCEGGNIWVDADVLSQNISFVGTLGR